MYVVASWTNDLHRRGTLRELIESGREEKWPGKSSYPQHALLRQGILVLPSENGRTLFVL